MSKAIISIHHPDSPRKASSVNVRDLIFGAVFLIIAIATFGLGVAS